MVKRGLFTLQVIPPRSFGNQQSVALWSEYDCNNDSNQKRDSDEKCDDHATAADVSTLKTSLFGDTNDNDDELALIVGESIRLHPAISQGADGGVESYTTLQNTATTPMQPKFAAIFCHPTLINTEFDQVMSTNFKKFSPMPLVNNPEHLQKKFPVVSYPFHEQKELRSLFSSRLLSLIHPFLAEHFFIKAIISLVREGSSKEGEKDHHSHATADIILIDLRSIPSNKIEELRDKTACHQIQYDSELVLRLVLLNSVGLDDPNNNKNSSFLLNPNKPDTATIDLPTCPVCLHRIDPVKVGLPTLNNHQLCSKFCPKPTLSYTSKGNVSLTDMITCPKQSLLRPWPLPCYCSSCHVLEDYWEYQTTSSIISDAPSYHEGGTLYCSYCSMQETLWVCLTCAFIGCGRYSNKHAAQHNNETNHPFCLELSTGRIWSYVDSEYCHRVDLLDCPCSLSKISTSVAKWNYAKSSPFAIVNDDDSLLATSQVDCAVQEEFNNGTDWYSGISTNNSSHDNMVASFYQGQVTGSTVPSSLDDAAIHSRGSVPLHHTYGYSDITQPISASLPQSSTDQGTARNRSSSWFDDLKSPPKKAILISEEYEALLQSALEEQAHYYESQITSLRAKLTSEQVNRDAISANEQAVIEELQANVGHLRATINNDISKELLQYHSIEAGQRATLQRLLNEQRVLQNLIERIQHEMKQEHEQYQVQVQELEYQIIDLTTNEKMRHQFFAQAEANNMIGHSHNNKSGHRNDPDISYDELVNAQIITTTGSTNSASQQPSSSGKKLKKSRRLHRR